MKRQPKDLITWEELEKMIPQEQVTEVTETETKEPPFIPINPDAFEAPRTVPQA